MNRTPAITSSNETTTRADIARLKEQINDPFEQFDKPETIVLMTIYVPVFLIAFVGNIMVLLVVFCNRSMRRSPANHFLVNLAVADILVTLFCMPMTVAMVTHKTWNFGEFLCRTTGFVQGICVGASTLTIVFMSADRYLAIRHPMKSRRHVTVERVRVAIVITWILACIAMIPLIVVRTLEVQTIVLGDHIIELKFCSESWGSIYSRITYDMFLLSFIYFIPGTLVISLYASMGLKLWSRNPTLQRVNSSVSNEGKLISGRRRLALVMIIVSILFAVSWLPHYTIAVLMNFTDQHTRNKLMLIYPFSLLLGHSNCSQNPVLYCFLHKGFKKAVYRILKCHCRKFRKSTMDSTWSNATSKIYRRGKSTHETAERENDDVFTKELVVRSNSIAKQHSCSG